MKKLFDRLYKKSESEFHKLMYNNLKNDKRMFIITANPETFMKSLDDKEIEELLLNKNSTLVPDGIGIVKAAKMLDYDIKERITGVDIAYKLLEYGNNLGKSIYLFGAKQEVIDDLVNVINNDYPNLKIVGSKNGYENNKDKIFDDINKKEPDIVLVALGIPAQEKLIYKHLSKFKKGIFVGVGGSFDVISGHKKRAPKIFIKLNLEWLYRLMMEPSRLKRFYDSNVKFLFKVKKIKKNDVINFLFILFCCLYLFSSLFMTMIGFKDINYYENRNSYKLPKINLTSIVNKRFQDGIELAFSDQIILSTTMKKGYNFLTMASNKTSLDYIFKNNCEKRYINVGNKLMTFGCDDNIVYTSSYVSWDKEVYDKRIKNINDIIKKTNKDIYIYYVEKDTDYDFLQNKESDIFEYLYKNINSNNVYSFQVNSFEDFKDYFYKTDHHWNHKGSYKAYQELVNILVEGDIPITYTDEECLNSSFRGSKANFSGASVLYKEKFYAYKFDFPTYTITINGEKKDYGNQDYYFKNLESNFSYGNFYGGDEAEIIFDTNNPSKENFLIFGESYDNAILKLLASHFNKTYSIDLRHYERITGKKFNYLEYIKNNDIDKILFIGNRDFFKMEEFNLEV